MTWKLRERQRKRLAEEASAHTPRKGALLSICLVYPNLYQTAMSNLGFQAVQLLCNRHPMVACERAFLPDSAELAEYRKTGAKLISLESQRRLADFDIIAFSVSFESDYLNIPVIFDLAAIPPYAAQRDANHPLVMAGGAAIFLNPEPVADFLDIACIGEAEPLLDPLLDLLCAKEERERDDLLKSLARLPGIYVPSLYRPTYMGNSLVRLEHDPAAPDKVVRVWEKELDRQVTATEIATPDTEFGAMHLVEISRGCPHGCRFCAAGFIYLPYRRRSFAALQAELDRGMEEGRRLGLVAAAVSDHPELREICSHIIRGGGKLSVSSLRLDRLDDAIIAALVESGHKTVAIAPEGGSQRLRDLIRKEITEEEIMAACERLIRHNILNIKLYFIVGLPTETEDDLRELVALVGRIRDRVIEAARANKRLGELLLSVNPFVPKPFTPLQWCGMEQIKILEQKIKFLNRELGSLSNVRMIVESPKDAFLQALLSRGDRRLAALLIRAAQLGNWRRAARELEIDCEQQVCRDIPLAEPLPWDVIDSGSREQLVKEYRKALGERADSA